MALSKIIGGLAKSGNIRFSKKFPEAQKKELCNSAAFKALNQAAKEKKIFISVSPIHRNGQKDGIRLKFSQKMFDGLRFVKRHVGTLNAVDKSAEEVLQSTARVVDLMG